MRSLTSIKNSLTSMLLTSPTWRRLLRGLLGQELVSWGAATAYINDVSYDAMTKDIHPSSASDLGLSLLSASYQIPFQNFAPGYILYKYTGSAALKPYELSHSSNGTLWFNIEPVLSGDVEPRTVKLYQGSPVGQVSLTGAFQSVFPNIATVYEVLQSDVYLDKDRVFFYVRLKGDNIIPSSIRVHRLSVAGTVPTTTYKASLMTSEEVSTSTYFSIYSLPDGGQAVRFHEAIPDLFQISYFIADLVVPESVEGIGSGNLVSMTNPSTTNEAKRSGFMTAMAKDSALTTAEQIERFCRAAGAVDAEAVRFTDGTGVSIAVFFIPRSESEDEISYFNGSLGEALALYGSIATNFRVSAGTGVDFQIQAYSVSANFDKSSFEDLVRYFFSVESPMSFSASLSENLLVYASDNGFSGVTLTYLLTLPYSRVSILQGFGALFLGHEFYKNNALVAWSFGSSIYRFASASTPFLQADTYFVMSKAVLVKGSTYAYVIDKVTGFGSKVDLDGYEIVSMSDDTVLFMNNTMSNRLIFSMRFSSADQQHAISTGVLPAMIACDIGYSPNGDDIRDSARLFGDGYFSAGSGSFTNLYKASYNTTINLGLAPGLLFVYKDFLYFPSGTSDTINRASVVSPAQQTLVSTALFGTTGISLDDLFQNVDTVRRFSGGTLSVLRKSDKKTFMFSLNHDAHSLAAASLFGSLADGFDDAFALTDTPARWHSQPEWYDGATWNAFSPARFSEIIGSILSGGAPSFSSPFDYDYLTVETSSVSPFSSELEAVYFRLNSTTPVVYKQ